MSTSITRLPAPSRSIGGLRLKPPGAQAILAPGAANDTLPEVPPKGGKGGGTLPVVTAPPTVDAVRPPEGGEGGDAPLPASPPSNGEFVAVLFRDVPAGTMPVVCSKAGDPADGGWTAQAAADVDAQCPADRNNYVACSTFRPEADAPVRARKEGFDAFHVLMLDDVGTKVSRDRLAGVTATWEVETSPGNSQVGFRLAEPLRDLGEVERLQDAVAAAGLSDPGAKGAVRWARLPNAVNGKAKYRDEGGRPFACRLVAWNPAVSYTADALLGVLGAEATAVSAAVQAMPARAPARVVPTAIGDVWTAAPTENPVLAALLGLGLYKREIAPGVHDVTCPWVGEHTDAQDGGSAYFSPDADHPRGGFKCQHSHGDKYHIGALLDFLGVDGDAARGRARIDVVPGEMTRVRRAAELSLAQAGGFYQMGGAIVVVRMDPATGDASVDRLSEPALTAALSDAADWYRFDKQTKRSVRIDPQARNVQTLLRAGSFEFLPPLTGIARQPFFGADGALVTTSGYDPASGRYGAFEEAAFALPEPNKAAARAAFLKIDALLDEFRFAAPEDRAAALCAMLTAAVRSSLPTAPAFSITAAAPGSGKSYLASTIVPFAGPARPANLSYPTTAEEASKTVLTVLASNPAAFVFDDMQGDWKPHGAINRMLTSDTVADRLLGSNTLVTVSTRALVLGTGNNIEPARDLARRVMTIRLHHRVERPALERYEGRPAAAVTEARAEYVAAALTIVAAWRAAGSPRTDLPSIASYGEWSDMCRQPLLWLGQPDPATSLIEQVSNDPDQEALGELLRIWHGAFGDIPVEVRRLSEEAYAHEELSEALADISLIWERDNINRSKLGWYLKKNANRFVGGFELQRAASAHRTAWRVIAVPG